MKSGELDLCIRWLVRVLKNAGRPVESEDVMVMARSHGCSRAMIQRARRQLGDQIVDTAGCWSLARNDNSLRRWSDPVPRPGETRLWKVGEIVQGALSAFTQDQKAGVCVEMTPYQAAVALLALKDIAHVVSGDYLAVGDEDEAS